MIFLLCLEIYGQHNVITVSFQTNEYQIVNDEKQKIEQVRHLLKEQKNAFVRIYGFANPTGSSKYNLSLSKLRAYEVANKINYDNLVNSSNLYIEWFGESNETDHLHYDRISSQKRCVDIIISNE